MNHFFTVAGTSFSVYIISCLYCEYLRRRNPCNIIQKGSDPVSPDQRENAISTAIVNLCIGMFLFLWLWPIVRLSSSNNLFFCEFLKLLIMFFISDTLFYWSHRILHIPSIYKIAHAQHHSHHEPVPWTSLFVHPIEFVIAFIGIFAVPILTFSIHPLTAGLFLSGVMLSLVFSHSGIHFGLINASHHDLHHQRRRGNYGSDLGIWDKICGTTLD